MRSVQFECLRPDEILEEQKNKSIVYLPIGPLEWHGPAMPFGTDPLAATEVARRAAAITGGVVTVSYTHLTARFVLFSAPGGKRPRVFSSSGGLRHCRIQFCLCISNKGFPCRTLLLR